MKRQWQERGGSTPLCGKRGRKRKKPALPPSGERGKSQRKRGSLKKETANGGKRRFAPLYSARKKKAFVHLMGERERR